MNWGIEPLNARFPTKAHGMRQEGFEPSQVPRYQRGALTRLSYSRVCL